jgi:hypothetical protein
VSRLANRERSIHVILFEQQRANETKDGFVVRGDADHLGAALDFAVEIFNWIGPMQLWPVFFREGHVGEHVLRTIRFICGLPIDRGFVRPNHCYVGGWLTIEEQ